MEENRQIVEALHRGDTSVFERIYKSWFARLVYHSTSIVRDREIAAEIVQSLFITVWEKRRSLDPARSLRNYMIRSVHNNSVLYVRSQILHEKHHAEIVRITDNPAPEESDAQENIPRMLDRLSARSRQVVYMSYFEDKRSREIAQELGITVRTVETILYQAIKKMKKSAAEDT